jgi:glycosyltransferase involved in cell wall biosynthesis
MTAHTPRRLKVLVSAYACAPNTGSEQGVGWECVKALAEHHDLCVITRGDARGEIESHLASHPMPGVRFEYYELPKLLRPGGFGDSKRPTQLYYYLWQAGIYFLAKRLLAAEHMDIVHHVTFVKFWAPSFLASLPRPFLWGPVGGGEAAPAPFLPSFSARGRLYERLRDIGRWAGEHDPFVRRTARRAAMTLASTEETAACVRRINGGGPVEVCPAIGVTEAELAMHRPRRSAETRQMRFVSIGRFLHWKGFHLALEAFAQASIPGAEYRLIGDGPERDRLKDLARRLGIERSVTFTGNIPRDAVLQQLSDCDVLVHPSLHESGGGVCLEAMAAELPVIAFDLGGPALHHSEGAGLVVRAESPEQAIQDLARAMADLAAAPDRRRELARKGRSRLKAHYLWPAKAARYASIYRAILGQSPCASSRP